MDRCLALLLAVVLAACGPGDAGRSPSLAPLEELPVASVRVGSLELDVALADSAEERTRGLAGVEDLGDLDGMLFVFPLDVETRFTMEGTLFPLDIAFVDSAGRVVDVQSMALCEGDPCPPYVAPGPYRWALETPAGVLEGVAPGDLLTVEP